MTTQPFTILDNGRACTVAAHVDGDSVRLAPAQLQQALGWEHRPEGLCRQGVCLPIPPGSTLMNENGIDIGELARTLQRPVAAALDEHVLAIGESAQVQAQRMDALEAPDFNLPDLAGNLHSLSDHRGKKVLLVAHASW